VIFFKLIVFVYIVFLSVYAQAAQENNSQKRDVTVHKLVRDLTLEEETIICMKYYFCNNEFYLRDTKELQIPKKFNNEFSNYQNCVTKSFLKMTDSYTKDINRDELKIIESQCLHFFNKMKVMLKKENAEFIAYDLYSLVFLTSLKYSIRYTKIK